MKKLTPEETNALAYALNDKLQDTVEKFWDEHSEFNINVAIGAANVFLATWLTYAPNKAAALAALEQDVAIIRNIIEQTPDAFFNGGQKAILN